MKKNFKRFRCLFFICYLLSQFSFASRHPAPIPNFTVSGLCYGDTTYFTNTSLLGVYYTWSIVPASDTSIHLFTSQQLNISCLFPAPGVYQVTLTADNGHIIQIVRNITIDTVTRAGFEFSGCQSQFINLSTCATSFLWDFGDGSVSTLASPIHNYINGGNYPVKLTATQGTISDTITQLINVPFSGLTADYKYIVLNDTVYFNAIDTVFGFAIQYHWSFGDGATDDELSLFGHKTKHHYAQSFEDTSYTVFLLVKTTCYQAYSQTEILIPSSKNYTGVCIYPNPITEGILHVRTEWKDELNEVTLFNTIGQSIPIEPIASSKGFNLDVNSIPKGIYILQLQFGKDVVRRKIIID